MTSPNIFDRRHIRRNLERAGPAAQSVDFLVRHAAEELAGRLAGIKRGFELAVDIGSHHGVMARLLGERLDGLRAVSLSGGLALAEACPAPRAVASEEALPLKEGAIGLITSVLSLQLVNDLPGALIQIRRALKPDGLFLGALLGGDSLIELRQAFMLAEMETAGGVSPRVFPAADVRDLGGLLMRAGFALPVAELGEADGNLRGPARLDAGAESHGRRQSACRAIQEAAAAGYARPCRRCLCGAFQRAGWQGARDVRDSLSLRMGAA